jgi:polyhydroxyalkanoate synthase
VPPCINKFYILDLQPANSFVRFAVEHGMTVFIVYWRNPDASCGHFGWDDYVEHGAMRAVETARSISGADKINVVGWCVGGTILSSALAILRTRGDESVATMRGSDENAFIHPAVRVQTRSHAVGASVTHA